MVNCFFCDPSLLARDAEAYPASRPLRAACPRHAAQARLADGQLLRDLLHASEQELDGPGLGFLFNPVEVEQKRCWTSWFGSSYEVHPELYPSANYYEFEVQHRPELVSMLSQLSQNRELFAPVVTLGGVAGFLTRLGKSGFERLQRLLDLWWRQRVYGDALRDPARHHARSAEEALALMMKLEPSVMPPDQLVPGIEALLHLAAQRFR